MTVDSDEIFRKAEELGIGKNTVYAAAKKLGVRKRKSSDSGRRWTWSLIDDEVPS